MLLLDLLNHIQSGDPKTFPQALELYLQAPGANLNQAEIMRVGEYQQALISPLMLAAKRGQIETMRLLIAKGAHVNYQPNNLFYGLGGTALIESIESKSIEAITFLLNQGAKPNTKGNHTALIKAVSLGRMDVVSLLLSYNANINAQSYSSSPFAQSVILWKNPPTQEDINLTEYLLKNGAHCTKFDFEKIFQHETHIMKTTYDQKRSFLSRLLQKHERLLPIFNAHALYINNPFLLNSLGLLKNKRSILIQITTHNNQIKELIQAKGFELAKNTPFPIVIAGLVGQYLFTNAECQKTLLFEFNRARENRTLTTYSQNQEPIPRQCPIL